MASGLPGHEKESIFKMGMSRDEKLAMVRDWFYPGTSFEAWFSGVSKHVTPEMEVCEIGSGSGKGFQNQQYPKARFVFGLDLDPRVLENPFLQKAALGSAYDLPTLSEGRKFDFIYSHMVVEHIDDPLRFIGAQVQCLKENGTVFHSTASKYYWSSLINNLVPDHIKDMLIAKLGSGRTSKDTFPAFYKLNCEADVAKVAKALDLSYTINRSDQAPGYLRRSVILMLVYTVIHKPLQYVFPALRPTLIYTFKKLPK